MSPRPTNRQRHERNLELHAAWKQSGDEQYLDALARENVGLRILFRRRIGALMGLGFTESEIESTIYAALVRAAITWDPAQSKYGTWAVIRLRADLGALHPPVGKHHRPCDRCQKPVSLSAAIASSEDLTIESMMPGSEPDPLDLVMAREHQEEVEELYSRATLYLTDREEEVLLRRFGHNDTLQEIANDFGVSRERIRQIEAAGLKKARNAVDVPEPPKQRASFRRAA